MTTKTFQNSIFAPDGSLYVSLTDGAGNIVNLATGAGGTNGQIQYNSSGSLAGFTASGDATVNTTTGAVAVTKTGGVSFSPSATTDTTNATNISSGTLPAGRLPALTGDVTTTAGTVATTLANTAVTAASYGGSGKRTAFTVDTKGRLTSASDASMTPSDVSLGNVTNDVQTKAAVVPNTAPSAAQVLIGNAGGTAYAPVSVTGDVTVSSAGVTAIGSSKVTNTMLQNSSMTLAGHSVALGGTQTLAASDLTNGTTGSANVVLAGSPTITTPTISSGGATFAGPTGGTTLKAQTTASGTLTLPSATDTLVALNTTDTLTNKTISGSSNTLSNIANGSLTNSSMTIAGHSVSLGGTQAISASDVGLGSVTNDAQTKAAIVPNTAPSSGQVLVGNAGGTAYAPVSLSGDITTTSAGVTAIGSGKVTNAMLVNSSMTIAGHSVALGGTQAISATDVGLGSVTNDAQTKASIVPNTAPAAGSLLVGNAGATAYASAAMSGDATLASTGAITVTKINGTDLTTAWTQTTPTPTSASGTFTSVSATVRYKQVGKSVTFQVQVPIVTNGTAAGFVVVPMPVAARTGISYSFGGRENTNSGFGLAAVIASGGTSMVIVKYDATYPGGDGFTLNVGGTYESA